ncbi:energy-coupling factor ABC transporter permease [Paludibacterium paludis]|uniref:Uncharacterized protein n=1 Tax=Paludibacterium paludis TaxID=1225769 RepID=A0A918P6N4_9NEIS|nr:energy-coupling factor ABC transporter permease [Paludibacterium paludis]GGY26540.1 hypothetical protein GCM10011289_32610 [Paludibacterium paludis]
MNYPASLFPFWLPIAAALMSVGLLAVAAWRVKWRALSPEAFNAWMGATVLVMVMWTLKGGFKPGVSFHLMGVAVLTLMMGPWLALLALAIALGGLVLGGHGQWLDIGPTWLVCGAVPALLVDGVLRLARRWLPGNLFVYVFVNAFMAGGASYFASALAGILMLGLLGSYPWDYLLEDVLPFHFLFSWSEAFTTGLVMAVLVVYRPHWVASFDDARYLDGPPTDGPV